MEQLVYRDVIIVKRGNQDYETISQYADGDIVNQHFTNIEAAEAWIDRHYTYNENYGEVFQLYMHEKIEFIKQIQTYHLRA